MAPPPWTPLAALIDAALPQTQCTRCGYPDCAGYAAAIASGDAEIDQCPPGGASGVERLATVTGRPVRPLNPAYGAEGPRTVAVIDEAWCIGCTLCIDACPTDAIVGRSKRMHTVIAEHCTGCDRCLPVCPVDCIEMHNASGAHTGWDAWSPSDAAKARGRYQVRQARLAQAQTDGRQAPSAGPHAGPSIPMPAEHKQSAVAAALARARARYKPAAN